MYILYGVYVRTCIYHYVHVCVHVYDTHVAGI